jgi:hypothetical protein
MQKNVIKRGESTQNSTSLIPPFCKVLDPFISAIGIIISGLSFGSRTPNLTLPFFKPSHPKRSPCEPTKGRAKVGLYARNFPIPT